MFETKNNRQANENRQKKLVFFLLLKFLRF